VPSVTGIASDSDHTFRLIVEAAPNAIVVVNDEGRMLLVNAQAERLFDYRRDDLIGRPVEMLVPERFRGVHPHYRSGFFSAASVRPMGAGRDLYGLRRDGVEVPVEIGLNPLATDEGTLVLCAIVDITERKRAETALREGEARLRAIVDTAVDGIITIDEGGIIGSFNPAAERLFGFRPEEVIGENVKILMPAPYREEHDGYLANYARTGQRKIIGIGREVVGRRKSGDTFPMDLAVSEVQLGERRLFTGLVRDISERKRAEAALEKQAQELARSNVELERFAYIASHDLQEPMRTVSSFVQLLARRYQGQLDSEADEFIGFITDGVQRMRTLIDDLLEYSRVSSRGAALLPTDAEKVLMQVIGAMQATIDSEQAEITHDPLPTVIADRTQLGQVLQNLIANAIKFHGAERPRIHISARCDGDAWSFAVADNGIGIPQQYQERIFVIFQRLHTIEEYGGTGIGLAICQKIVERHGGRIWVESTPGQGATFHFTLPRRERPA
jgi:PAS domain S-box-containing protein